VQAFRADHRSLHQFRPQPVTDPASFESFLFMPVTRDMSAGERTLLYKFLDQPCGAKVEFTAVPDNKDRFAHKSRTMRRPDL
jgi:hypothetical protein